MNRPQIMDHPIINPDRNTVLQGYIDVLQYRRDCDNRLIALSEERERLIGEYDESTKFISRLEEEVLSLLRKGEL